MKKAAAHKSTSQRIRIQKSLLQDTTLNAFEYAILLKLITALPTFNPSYERLATLLHISYKNVRTACDKLREKGYLKITITPRGQINIWTISQTKEFLNKDKTEQ